MTSITYKQVKTKKILIDAFKDSLLLQVNNLACSAIYAKFMQ